uniref:Polyamine aminopropyltransferase n=1 Tax=Candidatus Kentrum sp. TUN TaxID=2126343 RepID=A0A450ZFF5_9GAMM|nr:MAG: spermidine synthase [Candidatus Kentron sp. TUN]VFK52523.1 MAG: spermidine synthase [Candidatus Kentron sp. TUN]VFK52845.1 MAG: spermidine synthase [Candidatus Kentron sp. TUN]
MKYDNRYIQPVKFLALRDILLLFIVAVLAGCCLVYEYLISHYAGRVLGAMEAAIYGIIGIMIVSMGFGSFLSRTIRCPFTGFAWLEVLIALLGASAVLLIGGVFAVANLFPRVLANTFDLPPDLLPSGNLVRGVVRMAEMSPYVVGAVLGVLLGMEIPLVARVRQALYSQYLEHNTGSIYGVDYLGAGVGAVLWILFMLSMDISMAAALTASANIVVGLFFYVLFRRRIRWNALLLACHALVAILVVGVATFGADWDSAMEDLLYRDKVIYRTDTRQQHLTVTERISDPTKPSVVSFFINGRMQFTSADEYIYHAMLVYPALAASGRQDNILVVGGGDGLALRDILRWDPKRVVLLDLDRELVEFFTTPKQVHGHIVNERFLVLNERSFSDSRVSVRIGDAFLTVNQLLSEGEIFDVIIVDLPDPNHPDLNRLYSTRFYAKLKVLLAGDGAMTVQSTSPYHAKHAFLSIGKTMRHSGFLHVEQYRQNVPSFGEWGWTIATKNGASPRVRLAALKVLPIDTDWITKPLILGAFEFGRDFFDDLPSIHVNRLGSMVAYRYHQHDWEKEQGIYGPVGY